MKKAFALCLAAVLIIGSLSGCVRGRADDPSSTTEPNTSSQVPEMQNPITIPQPDAEYSLPPVENPGIDPQER